MATTIIRDDNTSVKLISAPNRGRALTRLEKIQARIKAGDPQGWLELARYEGRI